MYKLLVLGLFLILPFIAISGSQAWRLAESLETHNQFTSLNPANSVTQSFVARENEMSALRFLVGPIHKKTKGSFELGNETGELIQGNFTIPANQNILTISFNPIEEAKNKTFYVEINADKNSPMEIRLMQSDIQLKGAQLTYGGQNQPEHLVFQVGYEGGESLFAFWETLVERMSQYKPIWAKGIFLYFYFGAFFLLSWIWLGVLLKYSTR